MPPRETKPQEWIHRFTKATRMLSIWSLGMMYTVVGFRHFSDPNFFTQIVPPRLPFPKELVFFTGGWEIFNGTLLFFNKTRKMAAISTAILLVTVFPANIYLALYETPQLALDVTQAQALIRLPFQFTLLFLACWHSRQENTFNKNVLGSLLFYPTVAYFLSLWWCGIDVMFSSSPPFSPAGWNSSFWVARFMLYLVGPQTKTNETTFCFDDVCCEPWSCSTIHNHIPL